MNANLNTINTNKVPVPGILPASCGLRPAAGTIGRGIISRCLSLIRPVTNWIFSTPESAVMATNIDCFEMWPAYLHLKD